MSLTDNELLIQATLNSIPDTLVVGQSYLIRTLSLYWGGKVIKNNGTFVFLEPGSVSVILSVGDNLDDVHLKGVVDGCKSPTWTAIALGGILEWSPMVLPGGK